MASCSGTVSEHVLSSSNAIENIFNLSNSERILRWRNGYSKNRMNSAEDTTQTVSSSRKDAGLRVSRRDVLLTGTAGASLLAMPGASSAAPDETAAESEDDALVINVIGFEIDGPLDDCRVEYENERKTTDDSGTVTFETSDDSPEITLEKEGWQNKTETIVRDETGQEVYVPMYVTNEIDP